MSSGTLGFDSVGVRRSPSLYLHSVCIPLLMAEEWMGRILGSKKNKEVASSIAEELDEGPSERTMS